MCSAAELAHSNSGLVPVSLNGPLKELMRGAVAPGSAKCHNDERRSPCP
jgi:hypothetical protein